MEPKRDLESLFSSYVAELRNASAPVMKEVVVKAEKSIPKILHSLYRDVTRDIMSIYLLGYALNLEFATQVAQILKQKGISLVLWARFVALMGYIIPLYAAIKENKKKTEKALRENINQLHIFVISLRQTEKSPSVKESSGHILVEGFLKSVLTKVKNAFVNGVKKVGLAIVDAASAIVGIYNDIFSLITLPIRKVADRIPGGSFLLQKVDPKWLTLISGSPVLVGVISIHKTLTSPMVRQGAQLVKDFRSGELFKKIDNLIGSFMQEIPESDWKEIDALLGSESESQA